MSHDARTGSRGRVPAEHRVLGLDRRSMPPAIFVIVVFLVAVVVVPRIDAAVEWDDPVRAGETLALTDSLAFTPATGWNVQSGFRVEADGSTDRSGVASLTDDGVLLTAVPDDFDGTPAELLAQAEKVTSATADPTFSTAEEPTTITSTGGETGVLQSYRSVNGDGVVAAFVIDGTGVTFTAYGPPAQTRGATDEITAMITSIATTGGAS